MNERVAILSGGEDVKRILTEVDTLRLTQELGFMRQDETASRKVARLRVAANLSLGLVLGDNTIDEFLRKASEDEITASATAAFRKWGGLLSAMSEAGVAPSIEELLCFAAIGLTARRPTEVRSCLRQPSVRDQILGAVQQSGALPWVKKVRTSVTVALLLLIMQQSHADVAAAADILNRLSGEQEQFERVWLEKSPDDSRDALVLLGFYHLAQAVVRTSEFLLHGSLSRGQRRTTDFAPELGGLLVHAEEYLLLSGHAELKLWLNSVAAVLWQLRASSIWVLGGGISERLDMLMEALAEEGRTQPVFSLLPSQQDALSKNLLDPTRIAVVLQMPTSAGKTLLAEFAIVQVFQAYKEGVKVVYVTPTRALSTQVRRTLSEDLRPIGIEVAAAGSAFEEDPYEMDILTNSEGVIVATPEKLDLILRAKPEWFDGLRLVVVDEAHLLGDSERGVRLELLLSNLRREQPKARLLLMTPFVDNCQQIASWLGDGRGVPIEVNWRPSRILLGMAKVGGRGKKRAITLTWREPYAPERCPSEIQIPTNIKSSEIQSSLDRLVFFTKQFQKMGTILGMFANSRVAAEKAATRIASEKPLLPASRSSPALRVAIALARHDYGQDASLAYCLERGVAFHHSALSSTLRYLIEDLVRSKTIEFIAATSTLAQGMNFPVAGVIVHSVKKPEGRGPLTGSEFWNIAGRAGRVGLVDRGIVIFVDSDDEGSFERYSSALSEPLNSALLKVLQQADPTTPLKTLYKDYPEIRPFLQFLGHAAVVNSAAAAIRNLEELLQSSLAMRQAGTGEAVQGMREISRAYLATISRKERGYLKTADQTGLGSFSFDELYARIGSDRILEQGPREIMRQGKQGIRQLLEALKWLPELSLAIGTGPGEMSSSAVASVVQGWIDGKPIHELAAQFPGDDDAAKIRNAGTYVYGKVSQIISWGSHAYMRGWLMRTGAEPPPEDRMLAAYIQYGVHTPEAALAALLSVPRSLAENLGSEYRSKFGDLKPEGSREFKNFVETADIGTWARAVINSPVSGTIDPTDLRIVWRRMQGLEP